MRIARSMDKLPTLQAAALGYHHRQKSIRSYVERHSEEGVGAALIKLTGELTLRHIKLEEAVAGRKGHLVHLTRVPGTHEHTARIGMIAYQVYDIAQLVYAPAVGGRIAAPLVAVHGAEVSVLVGPFIPDGNLVVLKVFDIGVALDEPQKLVNDRFEMDLLGGQKRSSRREVEAHLVAQNPFGPHSGAVCLDRPLVHYFLRHVLGLSHLSALIAVCAISLY